MRIAFHGRGAPDGVIRNAPPASDETDDRLAGQWMAAQREPDEHVIDPLHAYTQPALLLRNQTKQTFERAFGLLRAAVEFLRRNQFRKYMACSDSPVTESRKKRFLVFKSKFLDQPIALSRALKPRVIQLIAVEIAVENLSSEHHASFELLRLQPVSNLGFGTRGFNPLEPLTAGRLLLSGNNLDGIAAPQNIFERDQLTVDPS